MTKNIYKTPESDLDSVNQAGDELASRTIRYVAAVIDGVSMCIVTLPVMYFMGFFEYLGKGQEPPFLYSLVIGLLGMAVFVVINWKTLISKGQTLGKRLCSIKVVTLDGSLPDIKKHFAKRYAVYFLPGFIPAVGGLLTFLNLVFIFGSDRRCIHDQFAGTKVVKC